MSTYNNVTYNFYNTTELNCYTLHQKYFGSGSYTSSNNNNWGSYSPTQTTTSGSSMQHVYYGPSSYNVQTRCIG
jgi:hypothetical protein